MNRCIIGDCRDSMRELIAQGVRVNLVTTSPPYWGLRDYKIPPTVWGGDPACAHEWTESIVAHAATYEPNSKVRWNHRNNGRGEEQAHMVDRAGWERKEVQQGTFCRCGAWLGNLGLEPDYRMFITNMVEVFRLVRDLMADDAVCFLNLGDSYAGGGNGGHNYPESSGKKQLTNVGSTTAGRNGFVPRGLKPKDMCLIPARVAIALQDDGWYIRSAMPWLKRNGMPDSVTDRPSQSIEYVYMLTKRERYFYDGEAVKVRSSPATNARLAQNVDAQVGSGRANGGAKTNGNMKAVGQRPNPASWYGSSFHRGKTGEMMETRGHRKLAEAGSGTKNNDSMDDALAVMPSARNFRVSDPFFNSWQGMWTDDIGDPLAMVVNTKGYKGAHFATFPPELIRPLVLAGTSAHGHCPKCGAGWKRIVEKGEADLAHQRACGGDVDGNYDGEATKDYDGTGAQDPSAVKARILDGMRERKTTGWQASCKCDVAPVPAIVFDPFFGSGTTGEVAQELGRNWLGCDISTDYEPLQRERTQQTGLALA